MKKKYLLAGMIPVLALTFVGVASAHGWGMGFGGWFGASATPDEIAQRQQQMFEREAQILGISVDDVKAAWAEGKTSQQIIQEKGLNKDEIQKRAQDAALAQMKSQLQTLVDKGIITQAQADKRLQVTQNHLQNGIGRGHMGMGMRFWR